MNALRSARLLYVGRSREYIGQVDAALQKELNDLCLRSISGILVANVSSQKEALEALRQQPSHAVLLEVDNRRYNRKRFCTNLNQRYPRLLIMAVSPEPPGEDSFPFDGHLEHPFRLNQAREILLSLMKSCDDMLLNFGSLYLDMASRTVQSPQGEHKLPPKQCELLELLMEHQGKTVSREKIMRNVWETEFLGDTRTLDVHVRWLREKIEPDPSHPQLLQTVRGVGYRLQNEVMV